MAYAGFAAFALMGLFNFILQAIPALFLFAVYAGILCADNKHIIVVKLSVKSNIVRSVLFTSFCITGYLTFRQFTEVKEYRLMKTAKDYFESGNVVRTENLLEKLQKTKQNSTSYCIIYGKLLFSQRKFQEALGQFDYAKKFSSTPILFDMAAQCHFQMKNSKEAISNLYQLTALSPKTIKYKFGLMQLLVLDKQIGQARNVAQQIITMAVINPDESTDKYQKMAKSLLRNQQKSENQLQKI
ncbi:tetratricopeptide repeat protein [Flavobacterium daejeonense]|uniref:tetratricopeptide repeat protein n=1 Tax=Flavobacterium daejeonense TaxID=350893 RepID=UPI00047B87C5|nr:CDC27 family protein [Flavobacterium daejeonense]